jgi:hypothetical protein
MISEEGNLYVNKLKVGKPHGPFISFSLLAILFPRPIMSQAVMVSGATDHVPVTNSRWYYHLLQAVLGHALSQYRVYLDNIRRNPGPFVTEEFNPTHEGVSVIERMKILLVGDQE